MKKLFGTDGIRGIAYEFLTYEFARKVGIALGCVLSKKEETERKVLIGTDTRESGKMLAEALCDGLSFMGFSTSIAGCIPTSAVAYLTKNLGYSAGVMITASHNPHEYNGIKIISSLGFKLSDAEEEEIESIISENKLPIKGIFTRGVKKYDYSLCQIYKDYLISVCGTRLDKMKIAIDCANGSAVATAKEVFTSLGASVNLIGHSPNGKNINDECGSTHLEKLKELVLKEGCDVGIAFDGDADRCIAIDERGQVVDGDKILSILALMLKNEGKLKKNSVVGTVMSNCGFSKFCENHGIKFIPTKVGDRYVLEEMLSSGYSLGGEQSGHIILLDNATTGDGQLTAIFLLKAMALAKAPLSSLSSLMQKYPQHTINIFANEEEKELIKSSSEIAALISSENKKLCGTGRVLIRPSGTEPLIRVMAECEDEEKTLSLCREIAGKLEAFISHAEA